MYMKFSVSSVLIDSTCSTIAVCTRRWYYTSIFYCCTCVARFIAHGVCRHQRATDSRRASMTSPLLSAHSVIATSLLDGVLLATWVLFLSLSLQRALVHFLQQRPAQLVYVQGRTHAHACMCVCHILYSSTHQYQTLT